MAARPARWWWWGEDPNGTSSCKVLSGAFEARMQRNAFFETTLHVLSECPIGEWPSCEGSAPTAPASRHRSE
eukprot:358554-Chlamydomonas_euryale.AAC.2